MQTTRQRHDEISRLIRGASVGSQEELLALLHRKGFRVTQPTLSRDLRALGVVKTPEGYALPDEAFHLAPRATREARLDATIRDLVVSAVPSGTIVVLRTRPAEAQPLARAIDEAEIDGTAGTLAGDDTVFVAMTSARAATTLLRRIRSLLSPSGRRPRP